MYKIVKIILISSNYAQKYRVRKKSVASIKAQEKRRLFLLEESGNTL